MAIAKIGSGMKKTMRYLGMMGLIVFADACGDSDPVQSKERAEEGDRAQLAEMRQGIGALVGEAACDSIGDCRVVGLGAKPCGGPWEFLVYSTASTDSAALAGRLGEHNAFEAFMNQRYGYGSDCSVPVEPVLGCEAGRCVDLLQGSGKGAQGSVSITPDQVADPVSADPVLPRFAMDMEVASDAFTLQEARVEGDILTLVVGFSGGCEVHEFTLRASLAAELLFFPRCKLPVSPQCPNAGFGERDGEVNRAVALQLRLVDGHHHLERAAADRAVAAQGALALEGVDQLGERCDIGRGRGRALDLYSL